MLQSTGTIREYTYYRCTKKKHGPDGLVACSQKPIRLTDLEDQIASALSGFAIIPEFKDWALDVLREENKRELDYREKRHQRLARVLEGYETEFYRLNKVFVDGRLDEAFYVSERDRLKEEITKARVELDNSHGSAHHFVSLCENVFRFACHASEIYRVADVRTKREIFSALGGGFTLQGGNLAYEPAKWFEKIGDEYPRLADQFQGARTNQKDHPHLLESENGLILNFWRARWDLNPRHPA